MSHLFSAIFNFISASEEERSERAVKIFLFVPRRKTSSR